ncbi:Uracil catabolism 4 [Pyrenophora seminiperda CCB06]|uniref:Uracil catabolism 4 n=1 Tax=Pyrenophora seminiperda CCB06 TaxID=1302712 RepID=A0A3M7MEV6_9PLEO|nr:Uracil catabolism 4 [Pyrenophora seminiperda CCB06]
MDDKVKYLLSLQAVRERASLVGEAAKAGKLTHFDVHEDKLGEAADYVTGVIKHFEVGNIPRITTLLDAWKENGCDELETTRRLIDLFFVSVLLDAGAGDFWKYVERGTESGVYERSEGIAVASLWMFREGVFAEGGGMVVDGKGLSNLQTSTLAHGFQISDTNPMLGIESRASLLRSLGKSLLSQLHIFGKEGRPGNVVDYMKTTTTTTTLDILTFWDILQNLLIPIWPQDRTVVACQALGDAWPLSTLKTVSSATSTTTDETAHIQPFHKLTQWLAYSLTVPFSRILGLTWKNTDALTALPEYRNGGLFVDLGVLTLKSEALTRGLAAASSTTGGSSKLPTFSAGDDVIVEWRAMTLVLVDKLYKLVLERMEGVELSMAQLLEAGTWKAGREVAKAKRPQTKSSPIVIESDGTVF